MGILLGNLFSATAVVLNLLIWVLLLIIFVRVVLSWLEAFGVIRPNQANPAVRFLFDSTEPLFAYCRRFVPAVGSVDLSPFVLALILYFLDYFIVASLMDFGGRIKAAL